MIPSIQLISLGDKKYEIIAQHVIHTFGKEDEKRTKRIIKFYKWYYNVKEALSHPRNPGMYFFCNELIDAKFVEDNIYTKQQSEVQVVPEQTQSGSIQQTEPSSSLTEK
jgi:hypothetical protein